MSDDTVLEAIKAIIADGLAARSHAIARGDPSSQFCEPIPAAPAPAAGAYDTEILAKIQEKTPNVSLETVLECCVRLIDHEKIRLTNTNFVRVKQNGHRFELRVAPVTDSPKIKLVKDAINGLMIQCNAQNKPHRFIDLEIFNTLATCGANLSIFEVNQICFSLVSAGYLKVMGGLEWFNTQAEGICYELVEPV